jgi:hypothetical protein
VKEIRNQNNGKLYLYIPKVTCENEDITVLWGTMANRPDVTIKVKVDKVYLLVDTGM